MSKKKAPEKEPNHERWLLTYSDLITLLMIFFVVMYSMSQVDANKFKAVSQSLSMAMGGGKSIIGTTEAPAASEQISPVEPEMAAEENKLSEVKNKVEKYLEQKGLSGSVSANIEERGVVISVKDSLVFDTGKADIKPEARNTVIEIGRMLNTLDNYVRIEGHTDNVPISTFEFKSNWELSAIRATTVTRLLIDEAGVTPKRLSAVGYGELRPIAANDTEEGRAKNRRVDIIVINSKFNEIENNKK